ncbi:unnamed protein product [Orchesella dallaii]|uniref:Ion transport domain-containing protein n=1 Tax=Orchesella dallaii TaxID=48710 RepID=A0ABP1PZS4_9HEXA
MWECVEANGSICIPFFITAVIVLNLIVLNLLLVMFLQRFSTASLIKNGTGKNVKPTQIDIVVDRFRRFGNWIKRALCRLRCRKSINIEENQENYCQEEPPSNETADLGIKEEQEANETFCGRFKFRPQLLALMHSKYVKIFNIGITILSAISLSLNDVHLKSRPWLQDVLRHVEHLVLTALCLEALVKVSAVGFSSYIKISWNRLDFIILLGSVINVISSYMGIGHIAFLKSIRVFRLTSNFEGMRKLLNSLGKAMGKIFGVLLICLLIWLVCAIIGVQLLNGRLYKCYDPEEAQFVDGRIIKNKLECLAHNFTWANSEWNFDNVGGAYYCILQVITFKGWTDVLYQATSSGEIDEQPYFENRFWMSGYFVLVILGGSFFAFNLFIGVLIDGLNEEKRKANPNSDDKHRKERIYTDTREIFLQKLKKLHIGYEKGEFQNCMGTVVTSRAFEMVVLMSILLNMVPLTMERQSPSQRHKNILLVLNGISTGFLSAECLLKLFATDYHFFKGAWNLFDVVVTTVSIADLIWQEQYATPLLPFSVGLLRLMRLGKVSSLLRQFKAAAGLRQLLSVLQVSLPAFSNMCILLFLVMFIYGTLGMEFFKDIKLRGVFDPVFNFQTLPQALIVLFQIVTAADNEVHCADVLDAAIKYFYFRKRIIDSTIFAMDHDESNSGNDSESIIVSSTQIRQRESNSANVIQRAWRIYRNE